MDNNPKGGELCRRRQVLRKTPSAGSSVTGRLLFYRTSLHHETVDNGKAVSGFEFQKLSDVGKFFWLMPIFCALTLFAGLTGKSQQIAGQLAGAAPFAILAYGLNQFGRNLIDALAPGAWIGLVLGVVLFLASRR